MKSFTEDWQAYSPRPPYVYGNVEFAEGGNLLMEIADVDAGQVSHRVMRCASCFASRISIRLRGFSRYFWKATRS